MGKPAIYLRVSSDIQRDKNSIESLARAMEEYEAVADSDDPAIQRQVIDRFIAELRASYVDGVIHREVYWSV